MGFPQLRGRPPDSLPPAGDLFSSTDATGAATWVGASQFPGTLAAAGAAAATFVGAALVAGTLAASGSGTATWVGASTAVTVLSSNDAAGIATFVSPAPPPPQFFPPALQRPYVFGPGLGLQYRTRFGDVVVPVPSGIAIFTESDASGTASWVGASTTQQPFAAAGTGTATFIGAPTFSGVLTESNAAGTATFTGTAISAGALASAGVGTASWVGASISGNTLTESDAAGVATFVGAPLGSATWGNDIGGVGTPSFVGASQAAGILSAAGSGTATLTGSINGALGLAGVGAAAFVGASTSPAVLSASGVSAVQWFGPGGAGGAGDLALPVIDLPELTSTGMMGGGDSGGMT